MMAVKQVHFLELVEIGRRLRAKQISPVELTEAMLKRIARLDRKLHSYALVTADLARAQARKAEAEIMRGRDRGPLHGVPIAVKDLCYTKGIPTAAGTVIHRDFKPRFDATVVQRLRNAGAVLLGKLQMTEGAFAAHHPKITAPVNPWHPDYWPGVSSSGSGVATAAGLCFGSLGSDTGGSIRFPSAANGLTGLKPTWGRVSRHGVFDLAPTLDHVGPIARSAADAGAILGAIAGADANDPTALQAAVPNYLAGLERGVRGLRIGVDRGLNRRGVSPDVVQGIARALKVFAALGAEIDNIEYPDPDQVAGEWRAHCAAETAVVHEATYPKYAKDYGGALAQLIDRGRAMSAGDYQKILLRRREFSGRVARLFEAVDLVILPTMPGPISNTEVLARALDPKTITARMRFTAPADLTGGPTITLPSGFTADGLPITFQLAGRHLEEDLLIRAGHAFQRETDWHRQHPKL